MSRGRQFQGCFKGSLVLSRTYLILSLNPAMLSVYGLYLLGYKMAAMVLSIMFTQYFPSQKGTVASPTCQYVFIVELHLSRTHSAHFS